MTNYNDGNWHGYNGQDISSVHQLSEIEAVWIGSCSAARGRSKKKEHIWEGTVAFRVTKEHREPREWWAVFGVMFCEKERALAHAEFGDEVIHVREVLDK